MKIGILAPDLTRAHGWGTYTVELVTALHRAGVATVLLAARNTPPDGPLPARPLLPALVPAERYSLAKMLISLPAVRRHLAACDLLHATAEPLAPLAALARRGRPLCLTLHGSYAYWPQIRRFPVNRLYRHAFSQATLLCVSHYTERVARQMVPAARTVVIPNAVDSARFAAPPCPPDPAAPIILSTGSLKPRKGTLALVEAVAVVREQLPGVRCIIAGSLTHEPAYVQQVRAAIDRLNLGGVVQLTGTLPEADLLAWYQRASVFVMPSLNAGWKFEGFGLVHLEASAAGLPVIGTRDCGAEDAIADGITGRLVSQQHLATELPAAILDILTRPGLAQQMGAAGRARAQRHTWDATAAQVIAQYTAALSARS